MCVCQVRKGISFPHRSLLLVPIIADAGGGGMRGAGAGLAASPFLKLCRMG